MRRLSIIPNSHYGSRRSSIGPDSPSLTFSHGSSAPILHNGTSPAQSEPNKLVKRSTSIRGSNGNALSRPTPNQRIPTLRRPATSHQRSVTLQQQYRDDEVMSQSTRYEELPGTLIQEFSPSPRRTVWRPYFASRSTRIAKERPSTTGKDAGVEGFFSTTKRVHLPDGSALPTLMKPSLIDEPIKSNKTRNWSRFSVMSFESAAESLQSRDNSGVHTNDDELNKRSRQSMSLHFSSPTAWITRSNSLRISTWRESGRGASKRNAPVVLASIPARATTSHATHNHRRGDILNTSIYQQRFPDTGISEHPPNHTQLSMPQRRSRNNSSPLPPISPLSSFNFDLGKFNTPSVSNPQHWTPILPPICPDDIRPTSPSASDDRFKGLSSHPVILHQNRSGRLSEPNASDRGSTLVGSDSDAKGFASGEDDETDFQSDTAYDSYRTGATDSLRARNTPLGSMFDESPPSSGTRPKVSEFHEMTVISAFRNVDESIVEEDEDVATPIKPRRRFNGDVPLRSIEMETDHLVLSSSPSFCLATTEFGRLSLGDEDEDEEDWTRDDDSIALNNPLSPPSNSINSQKVSQALRLALADSTEGGSSVRTGGQTENRPKSVFDWSEPLMQEKVDVMGNYPRPKTVHGKHATDSRGGRRYRPNTLHIRSQSVPIAPDLGGNRDSKVAPKFGTWGLGSKCVSEDWDNDFEFDSMDADEGDGLPTAGNGVSMLVPLSIRASQANVVGHVGQIREVCLLVEDLKRLRGLAREKGILDGPSADKWREAEGIIALAIPDEEDETLSPPQSPSSTALSRDGGPQHLHRMSIDSTRSSIFQGDNNNQNRAGGIHGNIQTRRQSVFSLEDDIFGSALPRTSVEEVLRKPVRCQADKNTTEVARSVMENIHQHRVSSDPILPTAANETPGKMPFDTTSLRDLVQRANALARSLSEIIRKADGTTESPIRGPYLQRDSSPAFTRVFTDPLASPPKNMQRTQSNNSGMSATIDSSPTHNLGQRMQLMAVN